MVTDNPLVVTPQRVLPILYSLWSLKFRSLANFRYPASRFGLLAKHRSGLHKSTKSRADGTLCFCGPSRFRTGYLLIANEALYQLSYGPNVFYSTATERD